MPSKAEAAKHLREATAHARSALHAVTHPHGGGNPTPFLAGGVASSFTFALVLYLLGSIGALPTAIAAAVASGAGMLAVLIHRLATGPSRNYLKLREKMDVQAEIHGRLTGMGASQKVLTEFADSAARDAMHEIFTLEVMEQKQLATRIVDDQQSRVPERENADPVPAGKTTKKEARVEARRLKKGS